MTTSLAQQLKQLAVPQTQSLLGQDTYKASFIFDPKDAASKDRETFFCIGTNGFEELCSLDEGFAEYESSLFSDSALWFERSIQNKEVNEQLDKTIDSFLLRLSPFLQLSSAKKALEWLIHRYRVHLNNVDSLMRCFLPYHQTELFVKMLQLVKLNVHSNRKWEWLLPVQKNAVVLTRQVLVNYCQADPGFLSIITDLVPSYIKVFDKDSKNRTERLRVVLDFYAYTLIAVLDAGPITERIISAILPVLVRGLKSDFAAHKATSYGILCKVLHKSTLKTSLVETLMNAVCKKLVGELAKETVLVLLLIFQTQTIDKLTKKTFKHITHLPTLAPLLGTLSVTYRASRLVAALLQRLIPAAVKQTALNIISSSSSSYSSAGEDESNLPGLHLMSVVYEIISGVTMDTETITLAARLLLENFVQHCGSDAVDQKEAVSQVKKVVRIFETRYADCLDAAVDSVMSSAESEKDKQVIKQFLNLSVSSVHHRLVPNSHATLALCLHHPNSSVRLNAVSYVLDNLDTMDDKESVRETFLLRLHDESEAVVRKLLKHPQKLQSVFTNKEELTEALLAKLRTVNRSVHKVGLDSQILGVLMDGTVTVTMQAVAVSYLLLRSPQSQAIQLVVSVLSSPAVASCDLLSHVAKEWLPKLQSTINKAGENEIKEKLSSLNTALVESMSAFVSKQASYNLIDSLRGQMEALPELRRKSLAYLLCEMSLNLIGKTKKKDILVSQQLQFISMFKDFIFEQKQFSLRQPKEKVDQDDVQAQLAKNRSLPAAWWLQKLSTWITSLHISSKLKMLEFWHEAEASSTEGCWLRAVIMVTDLLFQLQADDIVKNSVKPLIDEIPKVFGTVALYHRYLCVLCSGEACKELGVTTALQARALQVTKSHFQAASAADADAVLQSPTPVLPCLLVLCGCDVKSVRKTALEIVLILSDKCSSGSPLYKPVVDALTHYQQEISSDFTYVPAALEGLKSKSRRKSKPADTLSALLHVAESANTPCFVGAAILQAISCIDTMEMLTPLLPLLSRLLQEASPSQKQMEVMRPLLLRFTPAVADGLSTDSQALQLLATAIKHGGKFTEGVSVQEMAIKQITKDFFTALPNLESQQKIAEALLDVLQETTDTGVANLIRKVFKHVSLPADLLSEELAPILHSAASSVREIKRQRRLERDDKPTFQTSTWIRATVLLEIMQTKKKIPNGNKLVPVCFQILTKVLEVENAGEAEYLKQLILGVIHNLCHKKSEITEVIKAEQLNLDAIVQCIRTSHNPHTHQQALLVLSVAAQIAPEQLLHSMMSVFTFMGANILRQDDSYSFQVIARILETVFPALVMACGKDKEHSVTDMVTLILRVFVDTYPHIPVHRKLMVFATLLRVIGVDQYLWRLLLVFIEGVAVRSKTAGISSQSQTGAGDSEAKSKAIEQVDVEFLISLVLEFSPLTCVRMANQALAYLALLPDDKKDTKQKERCQPKSVVDATKEEREIFSLAYHNSKQLHKFKHATVLTLFHVMSNRNFIAVAADKLDDEMITAVKQLLETLLAYTANTSRAVESYAGTPHVEYWKGLLSKCNNLLDSLVSLLPQDQFLVVVSGLLDSPVVTVQRKAMELLATRLKHTKDLSTPQLTSVLLKMVYKLQKCAELVIKEGPSVEAEDKATNGKLALYTLMLLCRVLGAEHYVTFLEVLKQVCEVLAREDIGTEAAATAMICCAEIIGCIRAHAIIFLPKVMPHILQQLQAASNLESDLLPSAMMSLHKIMDTLPNFLTPYLKDILTKVCHLLTILGEASPNEQREQVLKSLRHTGKSLAALPPRVFLLEVSASYAVLLDSERQESIVSLLTIVSQHLSGMSREDLGANHHKLLAFFLTALDFRVTQSKLATKEAVDKIEGAVIETILTMVLKMAEATFRPMLLRMFEWATQQGADRDRIITFYRLADSLAGRLKGIFLLFAAHIVQHAAQLLVQLKRPALSSSGHRDGQDEDQGEEGQPRKRKSFFKKDKKGHKASKALNYILGCIEKVCLYDTQNFINKDRFSKLMEPLLDQIDNMVGGEEMYMQRIQESVVPAIANFAAATKNDALWKDINFQLMQKTRSKSRLVKMSALFVLKEMHKKLGEDYLTLLPETIPFLSELMEDDCEEVEKLTQEVLQEMEQTLGEPLQGYLS